MHRGLSTGIVMLCLGIGPPACAADAQQESEIVFSTPPEDSKYTQQLNIAVGDEADHIVRIFEIHRTYPASAPVINGLKLVEEWGRGAADYTDGNGDAFVYDEYLMENGDKFFTRSVFVAQRARGAFNATQVGHITGGTGTFAGMHGIVRVSVNFDPKTGFNETKTNIAYTIGR
jgi:hypothetical protein